MKADPKELSPRKVLAEVAASIPAEAHSNIVIIGSLATAYWLFHGDDGFGVRNAYDPESGTPLHRMLQSFGWNCDGRFSRRDLKQDVEMIAWMLRHGAKWIPPENDRQPDSLRRYFYRGEPKLVVEVIRLLDVADACKKALLRELIDKPKMRAWVGLHEPDLRDRLVAIAPGEESRHIGDP